MPSGSQTWSVVFFGLNEAESLGRVVRKTRRVLEKLAPKGWQIIIVDDGSTDATPLVCKQLAALDARIEVVRHKKNKGIGKALKSGYRRARYENLVALPADGQFDPSLLLSYRTLPANTFVSFFRPEKSGYSLFREGLSYSHRLLNRCLLGLNLKDVNWVKIYKTRAVQSLNLILDSSLVESEICAKLLQQGHRLIEAKSSYEPRLAGVSKGASFKTIRRAAKETLKLAYAVRSAQLLSAFA